MISVALMEGKALVATLFGGKKTVPDYENVSGWCDVCVQYCCAIIIPAQLYGKKPVTDCESMSVLAGTLESLSTNLPVARGTRAAARQHHLPALPPHPTPQLACCVAPAPAQVSQHELPAPPLYPMQVPTAVFCQPPLGTVSRVCIISASAALLLARMLCLPARHPAFQTG